MKTSPMPHQSLAVERSTMAKVFGFLFEMGCGKTWAALYDAETLFNRNLIDAIVVIAPKGVHTNWVLREIPTHMSVDCTTYAWSGTPKTRKQKAGWERLIDKRGTGRSLRVFSINVDAFNTVPGRLHVEKFLDLFRCAVYCDESTRIKNPDAKRTEHVTKLCRPGHYRRILTGSPVTKAPTDWYGQFNFLKRGILGTSYRAFVAEYAVLAKPESNTMRAILNRLPPAQVERIRATGIYPQVVETDLNGRKKWKNLDRLISIIAPHCHIVSKAECLKDLPPKVYKQVRFDLEPQQRATYDELRDQYAYVTDFDIETFEAIAARTKMKQVTSGYIRIRGEQVLLDAESNPRMSAFRTVLDKIEDEQEDDYQFIIFAIESAEIALVTAELEARGISFVKYDGTVNDANREVAIDSFQAGKARAFVGQVKAAGIGLTLTAAQAVIYFTTDCDYEARVQSEDRAHRKGQLRSVTYWDLIANDTIDEDTRKNHEEKSDLAKMTSAGIAAHQAKIVAAMSQENSCAQN